MNKLKLKKLLKKYKDDRFFQEVFDHKVYQPVWDLGEIDTVIDLGAVAGEFSFWIADRAKNVYAIEPEPEQFKELENNIDFVEAKNIHPVKYALGKENRTGHVTIAGRGGSSLSEDETSTDRDVIVLTLAKYMEVEKIKHVDVLKVDIECGETAVFGSEDFKKVSYKIDFIIGEHVGATSRDVLESFGFVYKEYAFGSYFCKNI